MVTQNKSTAGYDSRIATVFTSAGYRLFPFEAFDDSGNLLLPNSIDVPPHWQSALGRIVSSPVWSELYRILSVLDSRDPPWRCYMLGVGFMPGQVRLMVVKGMQTVKDDQGSIDWGRAFHERITSKVQEYAGLVKPIDSSVVELINGFAQWLRSMVPASSPQTRDVDSNEQPAFDEASIAVAIPPGVVFGAQLIAALVTSLNRFKIRGKVLSTVLWFPPAPFYEPWGPIHVDYASWQRRTLHMIWNPSLRIGVPRIVYGKEIMWRGTEVENAPHTPWEMCQLFDPTANCEGPSTASDETPAGHDVIDDANVKVAHDPHLVAINLDIDSALGGNALSPWPTIIKVLKYVGQRVVDEIVGELIYASGRWISYRLRPDQRNWPDIVYSREYQRLFYRQRDGSWRMGAVVISGVDVNESSPINQISEVSDENSNDGRRDSQTGMAQTSPVG